MALAARLLSSVDVGMVDSRCVYKEGKAVRLEDERSAKVILFGIGTPAVLYSSDKAMAKGLVKRADDIVEIAPASRFAVSLTRPVIPCRP